MERRWLIHLFILYFAGSTRCPDSEAVILDPSCHRSHNETCAYTCKSGYQPTNASDGNSVTCTTSSAWDIPLSSLCERLKCPATIPHGNISTHCSREYNTICYYYCDSGYLQKSNYETLNCNATGHWEWHSVWQDSNRDFCVSEADLCTGVIKNGHLNYPCDRDDGEWCTFSCEDGCRTNINVHKLTCRNRKWDVDLDTLCTDCIPCNQTIPHGFVQSNCYAGQNCSYSCYEDRYYHKNDNISAVVCSNDTKTWLPSLPTSNFSSESDLCLARRCSTKIPNGHLLTSCSAEVGSVCRYKCNLGFIGNESEIFCNSRRIYLSHDPWTSGVRTFWSLDVRQLCTNSKQCPLQSILGGSLDPECARNPGDICSYSCNYGYRATHFQSNQTTITCTSSSSWNASLWRLCEKIECPSTIPNGRVNCYGNRNFKDRCNSYYCNSGYQPSKDYASLTCNFDGQWEWTYPSQSKFCLGEDELCPSKIHNGRMSYDCHRHEGSFCRYYCTYGSCKNDTMYDYLTCHNKTWDVDTRYLCTKCPPTTTAVSVRCPSYIPGGNIPSVCDGTAGTWCSINCNSGCKKLQYSLRCNSYGEWVGGSSACDCPRCPFYIPNGYISGSYEDLSSCDFKPGSTCFVKCNVGCFTGSHTAYCESTGYWSYADSLCYCMESTPVIDTDFSEGSSTSTIAIVMSIVGVIAFLLILACVIIACRRQCWKPIPQTSSVGQSRPQQFPCVIATATSTVQEINVNNS